VSYIHLRVTMSLSSLKFGDFHFLISVVCTQCLNCRMKISKKTLHSLRRTHTSVSKQYFTCRFWETVLLLVVLNKRYSNIRIVPDSYHNHCQLRSSVIVIFLLMHTVSKPQDRNIRKNVTYDERKRRYPKSTSHADSVKLFCY